MQHRRYQYATAQCRCLYGLPRQQRIRNHTARTDSPVIAGIDAKDSLASRRARMAVYQRFIAELDRNNQHLSREVSEIDLSDPEDLRATIPEQGSDVLAHFGEDHFMERLQVYKAHIAEWRGRYPKLIGVDLRYNGEIPLEMATGTPLDNLSPAGVAPAANPGAAVQKSAAKAATIHKTPLAKSNTVAQKAVDARRKAARLKAAKAKAAHDKTLHSTTHAAPVVRQAQ